MVVKHNEGGDVESNNEWVTSLVTYLFFMCVCDECWDEYCNYIGVPMRHSFIYKRK